MPTTLFTPVPPAATATASETVGASPLGAVRALGVMLGGPLILLAAVAVACVHTVHALRDRRLPRAGAVAVLGTAAAYRRWMLPWMRRWGATDAELAMALPGDETVPNPGVQQTHVVQIDAPAHAVWHGQPANTVWPWIAQIGQDRGGFYSYTWLENLAGCRIRNADRIHPEWGQRAVGETVLLHPASGLKVLRFEPGRALVLEGGWSLVLEADGPERCRLLARFRSPSGVAGTAYVMLLELPHFLMERRMLLEIKRLAERRA